MRVEATRSGTRRRDEGQPVPRSDRAPRISTGAARGPARRRRGPPRGRRRGNSGPHGRARVPRDPRALAPPRALPFCTAAAREAMSLPRLRSGARPPRAGSQARGRRSATPRRPRDRPRPSRGDAASGSGSSSLALLALGRSPRRGRVEGGNRRRRASRSSQSTSCVGGPRPRSARWKRRPIEAAELGDPLIMSRAERLRARAPRPEWKPGQGARAARARPRAARFGRHAPRDLAHVDRRDRGGTRAARGARGRAQGVTGEPRALSQAPRSERRRARAPEPRARRVEGGARSGAPSRVSSGANGSPGGSGTTRSWRARSTTAGVIEAGLGRLADAVRTLTRSVHLMRRLDDEPGICEGLAQLGCVHHAAGRHEMARMLIEEVVTRRGRLNDLSGVAVRARPARPAPLRDRLSRRCRDAPPDRQPTPPSSSASTASPRLRCRGSPRSRCRRDRPDEALVDPRPPDAVRERPPRSAARRRRAISFGPRSTWCGPTRRSARAALARVLRAARAEPERRGHRRRAAPGRARAGGDRRPSRRSGPPAGRGPVPGSASSRGGSAPDLGRRLLAEGERRSGRGHDEGGDEAATDAA